MSQQRSPPPAANVARTPDGRFADLRDYAFSPHYVQVGDRDELRMHYVDEGPRKGNVVLLLHGEPSWSYLYRSMIRPLAEAGCRVVAPDLVGFGRSDKPTHRSAYSYAAHVAWLRQFVERVGLTGITLFCQDWGGLLGLRVVAELSDRFARVAVGNTGLPDGLQKPSKAFLRWREFSQTTADFPVGSIVAGAVQRALDDDEIAAYDAPFPDDTYKAGARQFPTLVPVTPDDPGAIANREAWKVLEQWRRPFLTLFSDGDPITRGADHHFQKRVPGCRGQPHATVPGGHFLQEDSGAELARRLIEWIRSSPNISKL